MKRSTFIASLFAAPILIKELMAAKAIDPRFAMGKYQPFKAHRLEGPVEGPGWIEFELPMTKMIWKMDVKDFGEHTYTMFGLPLPEFYNDQFRRSRRKNGLIKLGKARR